MRLFVALDIPEEVRNAIGALASRLRPLCESARWVRIEGAHVTLKFIGEVSVEKAQEIKAALAAVPPRAPMKIVFRGVGFFPNERRPRVLWAGVESGDDLTALAAAVQAVEPSGFGREQRAFSPHLTLARFDSPSGLQPLLDGIAAAGPLQFGDTMAKEFHLYQSVLKRGSAEYTRQATYRFSEGGLR